MRVILDTDIGDDIDDAFALALLLRLAEVRLEAVSTVHGAASARARVALRMLAAAARSEVPVYVGTAGKGDPTASPRYASWAEDWRDTQIAEDEAAEMLARRVMEEPPGVLTLLAVGPLSNVARAFQAEPWVAGRLRRLVIMGGSVRLGYGPDSPPCVEHNIRCDPMAAQVVFESGAPLLVVPLDATRMLQPSSEQLETLAASTDPLARALHECLGLWGGSVPTLFDPMAAACTVDQRFVATEWLHLAVTEEGLTVERPDLPPNAEVATGARAQEFLDWYFRTLLGA